MFRAQFPSTWKQVYFEDLLLTNFPIPQQQRHKQKIEMKATLKDVKIKIWQVPSHPISRQNWKTALQMDISH